MGTFAAGCHITVHPNVSPNDSIWWVGVCVCVGEWWCACVGAWMLVCTVWVCVFACLGACVGM